jgi:hypothetical protein
VLKDREAIRRGCVVSSTMISTLRAWHIDGFGCTGYFPQTRRLSEPALQPTFMTTLLAPRASCMIDLMPIVNPGTQLRPHQNMLPPPASPHHHVLPTVWPQPICYVLFPGPPLKHACPIQYATLPEPRPQYHHFVQHPLLQHQSPQPVPITALSADTPLA